MSKSTLETKLKKFVAIRNESSCSSNLQFVTDLAAAGLDEDDIGQALRHPSGDGYQWFAGPDDIYRLIEQSGVMALHINGED